LLRVWITLGVLLAVCIIMLVAIALPEISEFFEDLNRERSR
jgi:hypothetical protein